MAYYTNTVNSFAALKTAVEAHLVSNGYSITSDVISKNSCFYKLTATTADLMITAGVGQSGSTLTTPAVAGTGVRNLLADPFTFPITYELFINSSPDEVALVLTLGGGRYQQIFFGKSDMLGLTGAGTWISGSVASTDSNVVGASMSYQADGSITATSGQAWGGGPFSERFTSGGSPQKKSHVLVATGTWRPAAVNGATSNTDDNIAFTLPTSLMYQRTPNAFNQGTVLFPIYVDYLTTGFRSQIIVEPRTLRRCKIKNYLPGQIIDFAGEEWKLYPLYRKDMTSPDSASSVLNSGAHGFAVRYDP